MFRKFFLISWLFPQDSVLDMCSGPGGKSLAIVQTLLPSKLHCVDYSGPRLQRVRKTIQNYLRDVKDFPKRISYQRADANELPLTQYDTFDKVKMYGRNRNEWSVDSGILFSDSLRRPVFHGSARLTRGRQQHIPRQAETGTHPYSPIAKEPTLVSCIFANFVH